MAPAIAVAAGPSQRCRHTVMLAAASGSPLRRYCITHRRPRVTDLHLILNKGISCTTLQGCDRIPDSFNGAKVVYLLPNTKCPTGGTPVAQYRALTATIIPVSLLLASSL